MKKPPNFLQSGDYFLTFRGSTTISLPKNKSPSQGLTLRSESRECSHTLPSRKEEDRRSGGFRGWVTHRLSPATKKGVIKITPFSRTKYRNF